MQHRPLLVLGLDAAGPEVMAQTLGSGRMPTLARLLEGGCSAVPTGVEFISEHGVWVSLNSGVSRREHGYYWFNQLEAGTYDIRPFHGGSLAVSPFWKLFEGTQRPVALFDVPDTRLLADLTGVQVLDWAAHNPKGEPSAMPASVLGTFGPPTVIHENPESTPAEDELTYQALLERMRRKTRHIAALIEEQQPHLAYIVLGETHTGGHQFWRYQEDPKSPLQHAILDLYAAADEALAAFLASFAVTPNVAIVGSVGMRTEWPAAAFLKDFCRWNGFAVAPEPTAGVSMHPLSIARKLLPEGLRNRLSALLPKSTQSRLFAQKFATSYDWSRTRLFPLPAFYMGLLRVNLAGREPEGTVQPGAEYEALLDEATRELYRITDPLTKLPAVAKVHRTAEIFGPGPHRQLPDLFVEWVPGAVLRRSLAHPLGELRQPTPVFNRGSEHTQSGYLALAGPDIALRGELGPISPLAVAPTFAKLCGLPLDSFTHSPLL
jgi:predicted AlkP superfamily phosphohydrolase/phosphomutase